MLGYWHSQAHTNPSGSCPESDAGWKMNEGIVSHEHPSVSLKLCVEGQQFDGLLVSGQRLAAAIDLVETTA